MSDEQTIDPALLDDANPAGLNPNAAVNGGINLKEKPRGIRKINKKGLLVLAGLLGVTAVVATSTFNGTGAAVNNAAKEAVATQETSRPAEVKRDTLWYANIPDKVASADPAAIAPSGSAINPAYPNAGQVSGGPTDLTTVPDLTGKAVTPLGGAIAGRTSAAPYDPANPGAAGGGQPTPAQQAAQQTAQLEAQKQQDAKQQKQQALDQAMKANLAASGFGAGQSAQAALVPTSMTSGSGAPSGASSMPAAVRPRDDDQNQQDRKEGFLQAQRDVVDPAYSSSRKVAPRSPYELKAGGLIPAVLISGINSDLPGQVIAQVRENVYDTQTGRRLLIPQGTRLVGLHDSHVAYGQKRVLLAWNRMVYSDGVNVDLKGMPGSDMGGFAGFFDEVDNHYAKIFGSSALLSLISAGVQLSQPNNSGSNNNNQPSVSQTVSGALGQQLGQTGMSITQKNINIQPTLEIRAGYRFNIMVTADLILEPTK